MTSPCQAIILAAGQGTRLRPLSLSVPKPLFPLLNRPLLSILLEQVQTAGISRLAVNTHHLAGAIAAFLQDHIPPGVELAISHEPEILGTGGGLKRLAGFWETAPCLVINGDVVSDIDPGRVFAAHTPDALATLVLHDCPRFNTVWRDARGDIAGFGAPPPAAAASPPLAYTGIQVVSPRLLDRMPPDAFVDLIDVYRQALAAGERLGALVVTDHVWEDIGTPAAYLDIHRRLLSGQLPSWRRYFPAITDPYLGAGVQIEAGVSFGGGVCLGPGVKLGGGVHLKNSVIWANASISPGVSLINCIVGQGVRVTRSARGECLV